MNSAPKFKPYNVLIPALTAASTVHGVGLNVIPGENPGYDAIAVATVGAATGAPDSFTVAITVENSDVVGGTYTTIGTFATCTGLGNVGTLPITINPAKPFIRASAVIAFVNGTSPKIPVDVVLLVKESVATDSNETALS